MVPFEFKAHVVQVIFSFFAFPAFTKKYGQLTADGSYQVPAAWQTGLTNGTCIGEMIGLALTGIFADKYGQRWTIIGALALVVSACNSSIADHYR